MLSLSDEESSSTHRSKLSIWIEELRAPFFLASTVAVILGAAVAYGTTGQFSLWYLILTLSGILLIHAGANVANDFFDHLSRNDEVNVEFVRPFSGGSRMIQRGLLTPKEVLVGSLLLFTLGSIIGLYLVATKGWLIFIFGLIGVGSAFFYTAPPIYLAKRGIGEFFVGLDFGILTVVGSFYVQVETITWEAIAASIPLSFLIAAVLYINEFPDYRADKEVGKDTLVVRLGRRRAARGYETMMVATYLYLLISALLNLISPYTLIALATAPLVVTAVRISRVYHSISLKLVPANAFTILCHTIVGILMSVGYLLQGVDLGSTATVLALIVGTLTALLLWRVARGPSAAPA